MSLKRHLPWVFLFFIVFTTPSQAARFYQNQTHLRPKRLLPYTGTRGQHLRTGYQKLARPHGPIKLKSPLGPKNYLRR